VEALAVPDNRIILFQPAPDLIDSPGANVMHGLPYPSDLRTLAKKNGDQFPFVRVINVIDGGVAVLGHGEQMMPIWGERFMTEALKDINPYNAESVVRSRLLTLTYYLQSIQVQPDSKE
jgi:hypothetical protein